MKRKLTAFLLLLCLCALVAIPATTGAEYQKFAYNFFGTFDTLVTLQGYTKSQEDFQPVAAEVEAQFIRYHQVYDAYNAYEGVNNLFYLNKQAASGGPIAVEPELMDLLIFCKAHEDTGMGLFNIAMGSVLDIWHGYREAGIADPINAGLPPEKLLQSAAQHMNFDDVILDEEACTVTFLDTAIQLNVGAVAKGYATERVAQWLLESEMPSFLISAGGNIRVGEAPLDGRQRWGISIQDPDSTEILGDPNNGTKDTLFLAGGSVVTSGDYQRYYVVDGVRYHHLIDPNTLMPGGAARSVTIVCEDSGMADLLSTVVFLLPYEEGRAFVDGLEGVECYWIFEDGSVQLTDGMLLMSKANGASSRD